MYRYRTARPSALSFSKPFAKKSVQTSEITGPASFRCDAVGK
uniref:Uncharacterized protein n=1 Tax=Anguilla anguilla TaxID=7936 RepID=A0A0E9XST9_ANGAN